MKKNSLALILLIYSILSLTTLFSWDKRGINGVTGDEPHYLVMASGIIKHGTLEQTAPYIHEFETREIFKHGLAPKGTQPNTENTHAFSGPNGLFNFHNIGLPLLLSLPFMLGGVIGAKLFMIFCGSIVILVAWKFSSYFSKNEAHKFWAVTATAVSIPLIPASNQIYPDILAGLMALTGLYWLLTVHQKRTRGLEFFLAIAISFLPWLQIKFAATAALLALGVSIKIYIDSKDARRAFRVIYIFCAACIALALYNHYAFGKFSGPYQSGMLEISKISLMVLFGLHIDQNQGFLILNPVNLIGVLAIGWLYRLNRSFTLIWGLVFLSLIVPNALHPNWYGGASFFGRFGWAATIVFFIPVIYGLLEIGKKRERVFRVIISAGILLQLYFFYQYAIDGVHLLNRDASTWIDIYSIFYIPFDAWMPMLYNVNWAYTYAPNFAWLAVACALLLAGFLRKKIYSRALAIAVPIIIIFASWLLKNEHASEITFNAIQLPSQTGREFNSIKLAEHGIDNPGLVSYGPYLPLRQGRYEVTLAFKSAGEPLTDIGWLDILNGTSGVVLSQTPIYGTNSANQELKVYFETDQWAPNLFEFRTYWNGSSNIEVKSIVLKKY